MVQFFNSNQNLDRSDWNSDHNIKIRNTRHSGQVFLLWLEDWTNKGVNQPYY